jgi:hypothetical protein
VDKAAGRAVGSKAAGRWAVLALVSVVVPVVPLV